MRETAAPKTAPVGVYLHFPWCLRKCPYCDFVSFAAEREELPHETYADAVIAEIDARAQSEAWQFEAIGSVFVGGGTPSLWAPEALGRVLRRILALAPATDDLEVTAECNPSSLTVDGARALVDHGVNRLSVGVQSLNAERLGFLGRLHDGPGAVAAVRAAVGSGAAVSADLIYGVATGTSRQTPDEAADEARIVSELGVGHVSAYALTIEPNTDFGARARAGRLPLLSDALMAESFEAVGDTLASRGFARYEISNFATPDAACRHNLGYWRGRDYLGLGCAAVGTLTSAQGVTSRRRNSPNAERYVEKARAGDFTPHETEALDPETRLRERIMLGLRLTEGLDLEGAAHDLGIEPWPPERRREADRLAQQGKLKIAGGHLTIPKEHWIFADGIAAALF